MKISLASKNRITPELQLKMIEARRKKRKLIKG
jgi:hypothetical protein